MLEASVNLTHDSLHVVRVLCDLDELCLDRTWG